MARTLIDISAPLENTVPADPPLYRPKITYIDHQASVPQLLSIFPGLTKQELPDGEGWAIETVELITHNGTTPRCALSFRVHHEPRRTCDHDRRGAAGVVLPARRQLDFRHFPDGYVVTASDVDAELRRIGHGLKPLEIVMINTRAGSCYGQDDYVNAGCGMGREATLYLLERGVRLTGTDGWSWDGPFVYTAERYRQTGNASLIWEGHKAGREIGYCHLEKLHNLESLPGGRLQCGLLPSEGAGGLRRLDPGRGDFRQWGITQHSKHSEEVSYPYEPHRREILVKRLAKGTLPGCQPNKYKGDPMPQTRDKSGPLGH